MSAKRDNQCIWHEAGGVRCQKASHLPAEPHIFPQRHDDANAIDDAQRALTVAEGKIAAVKELRERWYKASKLEPRNEIEMVARRSVQEAIDQIDTILADEEQSAG